MDKMVEVAIDSVRVSLMSPQRLVVLREMGHERFLPIWVGPYEAEAITVALQEVEVVRPLTHDLLKNVFGSFKAQIVRVEIVALRDEIYFGNIVAEVSGKPLNIDSRPSDAIALAVRAHVPILVHPSVMDEAGIIPEDDITAQAPPPERAAKASSAPAPLPGGDGGDERLSVFEDFLDKLDKPGKSKGDDDDEPGKKPKPKRPKKSN
jgi:bifunctional DNase/RNase